ncbi:hypothetical protein [Bradyrhizobium sp. USDA 10063]
MDRAQTSASFLSQEHNSMSHPMSQPWLDWLPMVHEPHSYEVILYLSEDGDVWTGNYPEGRARGMWVMSRGGSAIDKEPIMWAHIPMPSNFNPT